MNKNLITKLTSILAAGTIMTSGLAVTGCAYSKNYKDFITKLSTETSLTLNNILYIVPEHNTGDNKFMSFIAHHDRGYTGKTQNNKTGILVDHKDYRITYEINNDEYQELLGLAYDYNKSTILYYNITDNKDIAFLNEIVDKYDPINITEYEGGDMNDHEYSDEYEYRPEM